MTGASVTTLVVIMAGGRGLRLHPLTEHTPKPMLRVGSKPLLESLIGQFRAQGFREFVLCVNYKADLIEGYFGSGGGDFNITYVHETEPLGTAGALRLMMPPAGPFIVANADVLTRVDYAELVMFHVKHSAAATVCLALHQYQVPYGVVEVDGERFVDVQEKPIQNYPVAAGVYVMSPSVLRQIPEGRMDMPDLILKVRDAGGMVMTYPINEPWLDVGTFASLEQARSWPA